MKVIEVSLISTTKSGTDTNGTNGLNDHNVINDINGASY